MNFTKMLIHLMFTFIVLERNWKIIGLMNIQFQQFGDSVISFKGVFK